MKTTRDINEHMDIKRSRQYVYLSAEHKQMLKVIAKRKGVSVSKYILDLILDDLISSGSMFDYMKGANNV